ncbi:MAG: hypothetical protein NTX04_03255, partial [Verrucomicrobia bacterium]|nr:hypothetical protein [Verrucomicrobiota bacterium]
AKLESASEGKPVPAGGGGLKQTPAVGGKATEAKSDSAPGAKLVTPAPAGAADPKLPAVAPVNGAPNSPPISLQKL